MGPEILIVGDRTHRSELVPRVQDLGYAVAPVRERELLPRVAQSRPAAVIVCLGGGDTGALVQALRGSREGAAIPVLLVGRLQGELRDFADVLELGADRFLEAPVDPAELEAALAELAGPPQFAAATPVPRESPARDAGDPVLDRLHQTLAGLAARLEAEAPAEGERDAIDLEAMGLDAVPDVDREHPGAGEFEFLRPQPRGRAPEPAEEVPVAPRARERTEPLPRAPRTGAPRPVAGRDPDSPTLRLAKSRAVNEEGPREADVPMRRDPTSDRTVPIATAAREDVRRDRTERGRSPAERGWPKEQERREVSERGAEAERSARRPPASRAEETGRRVETPSQRQTGRWRVERADERETGSHGRSVMPEEAGPEPGRGEETWSRRQVRPVGEREEVRPRGRRDWPEGQVEARARRPEEFDESSRRTPARTRWDGADEELERPARPRRDGERPGGRGGAAEDGWPEGQARDGARGERQQPGRRWGAEGEGWPEGQERASGRDARGREEREREGGRRDGEDTGWSRGQERAGRGERWPSGRRVEEERPEEQERARRWETEAVGAEEDERPVGRGRQSLRAEVEDEGRFEEPERRLPGRRAAAVRPEGQEPVAGERAGRRWGTERIVAEGRPGRAVEEEGGWPEGQERPAGRGGSGRRAEAEWPEGQEPAARDGRRWGSVEEERPAVRARGPGRRAEQEDGWSEGQARPAGREQPRRADEEWPEGQERSAPASARTGRRWGTEEERPVGRRRGDEGEGWPEGQERPAARAAGRRGRWGAQEDAGGEADDGWPEGQGRPATGRMARESERSMPVARAPIGRREPAASRETAQGRRGQDARDRAGGGTWSEEQSGVASERAAGRRSRWGEEPDDGRDEDSSWPEGRRGADEAVSRSARAERGWPERQGVRDEVADETASHGARSTEQGGRGWPEGQVSRASRGARAAETGVRGWPQGQDVEEEAGPARGGTEERGSASERRERGWPERRDDREGGVAGRRTRAAERGGLGLREAQDARGGEGADEAALGGATAAKRGGRGWPEGQDGPGGADDGASRGARAAERGGEGWPEGQAGRGSEGEEPSGQASPAERGKAGVGLAVVVLPALPEARERGEGDPAELLAELHRERFSGCLQVFAQPERRVWWSEGQVIGGASEAAGESILGRLWARGLLGATHLELAERWSTGDPRRDVERLAQAGLLKPQEVQEALREPVRGIVAAILGRGTVAWGLHPGERPAAAIELGVPLAALIAEAVRGATVEELRAAVPDAVRPRVGLIGPEALAAELRWPELAAIAERFDGEATVGELIATAAADEAELRAAARVLGLLGHLAPVGERGEESLLALDRRRVRERLRLARETDYFGLLGLPRGASRAEVRRAHADLSATFREGLEPASRAELAEELAELYAALDEARDVLTDEALHSAYLGQLGEG